MPITKTFPATTLLSGVTSVQTSDYVEWGEGWGGNVQADISGTGAVTATINVYVGLTSSFSKAILLGTISLNGTATDKGGFSWASTWPFVWADLTAISGTGAAVTVNVGGARG